MQRDHSRSDGKQERLRWDFISDDENLQPPRKRKKLDTYDPPEQEVLQFDKSQTSTPRRIDKEVEEEQIVVSEGEFS